MCAIMKTVVSYKKMHFLVELSGAEAVMHTISIFFIFIYIMYLII